MILSDNKTIVSLAFTIVLALVGLQACGSSSSGIAGDPIDESIGFTGAGSAENPADESRGQLVGYSEIITGDLYSIPAIHYKVVYKTLDTDGSLINAQAPLAPILSSSIS